jgi:hypothetical protein
MIISERINELKSIITSFTLEKNIPIFNTKHTKVTSLDDQNQCVLAEMNTMDVYLIAHEDLNIVERFLNLKDETINKINKIRTFCFGFYGSSHHVGSHKRLKIKLIKDKGIEFSIIGAGLPPFVIELKDHEIVVSVMMQKHDSTVAYSGADKLEDKLNAAFDLIIPNMLNALGFFNCTEDSEEVIDFMNKSTDELLIEHFSGSNFNYINKNALLLSACSDLNLNLDDLLNYNKDNKNITQHMKIPTNMISVLSKAINKLIESPGSDKKINQLINLVSFYHYLTSTKSECSITFKEFSKTSLVPSATLDFDYCYLNFSDILNITLGHQLKPNDEYNDIYENIIDQENENGYLYNFLIDIEHKDPKPGDKFIKYFTNDIDYIYNVLLMEIKKLINKTISNTEDVITSRQLEVFKMATV